LGNAGTLEVNADKLQLNEEGQLTASTVEGMGGNIHLNTDSLALRRGSRINTDAENTDGGNIDIRANTIVASGNSDITANALEGRGGRVTIVSQAIFGMQFRDRQTPKSDITATSELGSQFEGTVSIDTPEIDPSAALLDMENKINTQPPVVASACDRSVGSEFVISGRENLPPKPAELANNQAPTWLDWRWDDSNLEVAARSSAQNANPLPADAGSQRLIEAQGWVKKENGVVQLVAPSRSSQIRNPIVGSGCLL
jgi:large exoprotein involved in heme utilization and adhesion